MANILHMDPSAVQQLNNQLLAACDAIKLESETCVNRCSSHVGSGWMAPCATEFQNLLSQQHAQMTKLCATLQELNQRLPREIAQWQEAQRSTKG